MTSADVPHLVPLCEAFCEEIGWSFDADSAKKTMSHFLDMGWFAMVDEHDGKLRGLGMAMLTPLYANYGETRAVEIAWHSAPWLPGVTRARIMVDIFNAMEAWARDAGAPFMLSTGTKSTQAFLERRGYKPKEVFYAMEGL